MAVTLSTTPSSADLERPVNARTRSADAAALVCATSAGVHAALVMPHAEESARMATAFAVATVALAAAAVGLAVRPEPAVSVAAAVLLLGVAAAYLLSRTTGIPGLTPHREPFDALGVLVTSLEVAGAVVVSWPLIRRSI
jgi:hypothetical protein